MQQNTKETRETIGKQWKIMKHKAEKKAKGKQHNTTQKGQELHGDKDKQRQTTKDKENKIKTKTKENIETHTKTKKNEEAQTFTKTTENKCGKKQRSKKSNKE